MKGLKQGTGVRGCDIEESNEVAHCKEIHLIIRLPATLGVLLKHLSALQSSMSSMNSSSLNALLGVMCTGSVCASCLCMFNDILSYAKAGKGFCTLTCFERQELAWVIIRRYE